MTSVTLYVGGMHCPNCEIFIERRLGEVPGVAGVRASLRDHTVTFEHDGTVTADDLRAALTGEEYSLHEEKPAPGFTIADRQDFALIGFLLLLVASVYILLEALGLLPGTFAIPDNLGFGVAFLIGLIASVSTCMAVAGGLMLAIAARYNETHPGLTPAQRLRPQLYFNIGRVISYTGFGALIGLLGASLALSPAFNALLVLVASLVMVVLGLQMLRLLPVLGLFRAVAPKALSGRIHAMSEGNTAGAAFGLGAATFFLPCGFTQALQLYVLAQGNAGKGALIMLAFSLGTLPALLSLSAVSSYVTGVAQRRFIRAAGVAVVIAGLFSLHGAWTLGRVAGIVPGTAEPAAMDTLAMVDGKQVADMTVVGLDYQPNVFRVVAGTPVEWRITAERAMGCARMLIAPDLGVRTVLSASETNVVTFTPDKPGEYIFNCGMGMMPADSRFIVVPKSG
jgi:sulfite exporter TauE/SafE/copper chaperone CopZ